MTWLQPWAAWFLAGIPAIVLLYFLRLKRRPVSVSTLMFWQRVMQESGRRAVFQKLRHLLSLLLHLVIFLLLLAALGRPDLNRSVRDSSGTVLIVDTRARMQAVEPDGVTQFEKALRLARDYARQAGSQREFALLTLASQPTVTVPFTSDEKPLLNALDQLAPTESTGDLQAAIAFGDSLLAARNGERRIVLLTDRSVAPPAGTASEMIAHAVGSSLDNVAITRFATRPLPGNLQTSEVLLETRNFGRTPVRTDVEISFDGRTLEVKPLALAPGERRIDIFASVPLPVRGARGWLTAKLSANDALPLDNIAYATLPPARLNRVLLVSNGNTFLEKLLGVDSSLKFQFVAPASYQPGMGEKFEAVVFDGAVPPSFDLNATHGNFLFLKATPFATNDAILEQPVITDVDATHPATRLASLQNITVLRAQKLALPAPHDGWTFSAPLRSAEHPLLITGERGRQRIAALAFDVLESDLPLRVAFPLLIHGTLEWLSGGYPESPPSLAAGEVLALPSGESAAQVPLTAPPGPRDVQPQPMLTGFFQPLRNGFYQIADADSKRWLAVNTFSAEESDLRIGGEKLISVSALPASLAGLHGWQPWRWLALTAFLLLVAEWLLFHRRKTE